MLRTKSLRDELAAAGLFQRCEARTWGKLGFLMTVIGGLLVAHAYLPFWWSALLAPVTAFFCGVAAMIGHEGSHRGLSTAPWRNRLMFNLTFPVFGGVSGMYWHWKHDIQHHAYPNVADVDPDILLWPMASTADEYRRSSPARQWFQRRLQGAFFWPLCLFLVWSMRTSALAHLYRHARTKGMNRTWWIDVSCLALHVLGWVVVPTLFFGPWAIALYALIWTFVGLVLSMVFAPAHIGMPVVEDTKDIWRLQFETTRNLKLPAWLSFFFIGLDYQIEHHLFPKIPHQRLPEAAAITRAWAERNGVPYHEIGYWDGVRDVTRFMGVAWEREAATLTSASPDGTVSPTAPSNGPVVDTLTPPGASFPLAR